MNTTLLFAEILIVGLQSGVWLTFLILSIFGVGWFQNASSVLKDWQTALLAVFIPLLYVIGIIIDRLADRVYENWNERIKKQVLGNTKISLTVMRFALGKDNDFLNQQIEYTRTRMRIARASSINFLLIAILISTFITYQVKNISVNEKWGHLAWIIGIGLFLSISAAFTWRSLLISYIGLIQSSYHHFVNEFEDIIEQKDSAIKRKEKNK